jgi:lipopolysaccharide export system permease protein
LKRIDRLILGELWGPWMMGVAMFGSLLIAATYLGRITGYIVDGVSPILIGKITLLLMGPILVQTFSMATLLGALLAFGRLSGDSEIVAMRAAGAGIYRIIAPVAAFSLVITIFAFILNDTMVPYAAKQSTRITEEVAKSLKNKQVQPTFQVQTEEGVLKSTIQAVDYNLNEGTLNQVIITSFDEDKKPKFILLADRLKFRDKKDWRIIGEAKLLSTDGKDFTVIKDGMWPAQMPSPDMAIEQIGVQQINDANYFSTSELRAQLARKSFDKSLTPEEYRNREYWLWNKFAVPLAAFVFGVLGAVLGIRSHRAGTSAGFAMAIGISFAYMVVAQFLNTWAMGGVLPPAVAAFTPTVLGLSAALMVMWRRNTG